MAMLFWGISYVWTKIVFEFYQPVTIMFIRLSISSLMMLGILRLRGETLFIERKDRLNFVYLAFFSPFCYFLGENYGLLHVSPTVASVIIATIPLFAPILGFIGFREKLTWVNMIGFLVSFGGIWVMVLDQSFRFSASPKGVLMLFFAVAAALVNMLFLKKLARKYSPYHIIFVQNSLGALMFFPVFMLFEFNMFIHIRPSSSAIFSLLALALFGSSLAFVFYTASVRTLGIARTSIFGNLIPIFTAITSLIILKEVIDGAKLAGMALVITGLFMTQVSTIRKKRHRHNHQQHAQKNGKPIL